MKPCSLISVFLLCLTLTRISNTGIVDGAYVSLLESACAVFAASGVRIFTRPCPGLSHSCSLGPLLLNASPGLDVLAYFCNQTQSSAATNPTTTTTTPTTTTPKFTSNLHFYIFDKYSLTQLSKACEIKNGLVGVVVQTACPRRQQCGASYFKMNLFGIDSTVSFCTKIADTVRNTILRRLQRMTINKDKR